MFWRSNQASITAQFKTDYSAGKGGQVILPHIMSQEDSAMLAWEHHYWLRWLLLKTILKQFCGWNFPCRAGPCLKSREGLAFHNSNSTTWIISHSPSMLFQTMLNHYCNLFLFVHSSPFFTLSKLAQPSVKYTHKKCLSNWAIEWKWEMRDDRSKPA